MFVTLVIRPAVLLGLALGLGVQAMAQTSPSCGKIEVFVYDKDSIYMHCEKRYWPELLRSADAAATLWELPEGWGVRPSVQATQIASNLPVRWHDGEGWWLQVALSRSLEPDKEYIVVVAMPPEFAQAKFSTKAEASLSTAFEGEYLRRTVLLKPTVRISYPVAGRLSVEDDVLKTSLHKPAFTGIPAETKMNPPNPADIATSMTVTVALKGAHYLRAAEPNLRVEGLTNIFGQPVKAEGKLKLGAPPKGKEDSKYYLKFGHEAGKGMRPSLLLDFKFAPVLKIVKAFEIAPLVDINISHNVENGPDKMLFGLTFRRTDLLERSVPVSAISYPFGFRLEMDRAATKMAALGDVELQPWIYKAYVTREMRTLADRGAFEAYQEKGTLEPFGYGFELAFGTEFGHSIRNASLQNNAKTSTLDIPGFAIARFRPRARFFLEYGRWTWETESKLRYLSRKELLGVLLPNDTLTLRTIRGFRPYTETKVSFSFDEEKRYSLEIKYKNGSEPPKYQHTSKFESSIVLKY